MERSGFSDKPMEGDVPPSISSLRQKILKIAALALALGSGVALVGCSSAGNDNEILASYSRGFSVVLTEQYNDTGPASQVQVKNYSDLQQLYTDLLSGQASMTIGGPDVFASQADKGAPIHLAATISPNSTTIVGRKPIRTSDDVRGSRIAATVSSGGWHLTEAALHRAFGLSAGKDYELVNVPEMASGAAQVVAGTTDYVVGWEPSVNSALKMSDDLMVSYSVANAREGETFGTGWQLVLAVRNDVDKTTEDAVIEGLQQSAQMLLQAPDKADSYGTKFGFAPGTTTDVMGQSVPPFVVKPIDAESKEELQTQLAQINGDGGPLSPPNSFYGGTE